MQTKAADETKAVFSPLKQRTTEAVAKLEDQIALSESSSTVSDEEMKAAQEVLKSGQGVLDKTDDEWELV